MDEKENNIYYHGKGTTLFGLYFINVVLSMLTLGIYSFWGKAKILRYIYSEAEFAKSRFSFHGTGKQLFFGFLKALGIFIVFYIVLIVIGVATAFLTRGSDRAGAGALLLQIVLMVFVYGFILVFIPIAMNSRLRYRMAMTSWRNIRLGYFGKNKELIPLFIGGTLLTAITLGVYGAWFSVKLTKYLYERMRFGNIRFVFKGDGMTLFFIHLKGILLSIVTLGIYSFWYSKNLYAFRINNMQIVQGPTQARFVSHVSAGKIFRLHALNLLLIIVTLGLAYPLVVIRTLRFQFRNVSIDGTIDTDSIVQSGDDYKSAFGEDMSDFLDIGDFGLL